MTLTTFKKSFKIDKYIYFKKKYLPELIELKKHNKKAKKFNPDILLAIGGGCALDYAKIVLCL